MIGQSTIVAGQKHHHLSRVTIVSTIVSTQKPPVFWTFTHFSPCSQFLPGICHTPGHRLDRHRAGPGVGGLPRALRAARGAHLSAGAAGAELRRDPVPGLRMPGAEHQDHQVASGFKPGVLEAMNHRNISDFSRNLH